MDLNFHVPESYQSDQQKNMASTSQFLGRYDDRSLFESGLYKRSYNDMGDNYYSHQSHAYRPQAAGKSIDPRLLMLLQYFRELYVRKSELFKKIFPGIFHDEFAEFFRKIGGVLSQAKTQNSREVKTMKRSLSLGSRGTHEPPLRPDRFKIRTVIVDEVGQGGGGVQGGQGDTNSSGSK
ncbi:Protease Do-like 4, mitochondrial [Melia azedarach]|uniref:Protease Do-like 4, mitochondrial n=1 Tax=Melia azedarach TaxID=155640 RepID=A0ACC1YA58_MELAZ|nr:Protease Do-like 4, mitochondrial [Melia azedarach]